MSFVCDLVLWYSNIMKKIRNLLILGLSVTLIGPSAIHPVYAGYECSDFSEGSEISFAAAEEFIKNPPLELFKCNYDDDCAITGDPCGWPIAVNNGFANCYSRAAQWAGASLGCAMYQGEERIATCTDGRCQMK